MITNSKLIEGVGGQWKRGRWAGRARDVLMRSFLFLRSPPPPPTWLHSRCIKRCGIYILERAKNWKGGEGVLNRGNDRKRILFSDPLPPLVQRISECYRDIDSIGLILTTANRHIRLQPSLAFYQNGYRSEDALFFAGQIKPRASARHRPVPCREKSADSLFNGYLISF